MRYYDWKADEPHWNERERRDVYFPDGVSDIDALNDAEILPADRTPEKTDKLDRLRTVPFGLVNVVGGYHTAMIVRGEIFEVHWTKGPKHTDLYEATDFKTWEDGFWGDGIIHVPSTFW